MVQIRFTPGGPLVGYVWMTSDDRNDSVKDFHLLDQREKFRLGNESFWRGLWSLKIRERCRLHLWRRIASRSLPWRGHMNILYNEGTLVQQFKWRRAILAATPIVQSMAWEDPIPLFSYDQQPPLHPVGIINIYY